MIKVSKQYSVEYLIRELGISEDEIKYMNLYGKAAVDLVIVELLCRGYSFLYTDVVGKCFIILEAPLNPKFETILSDGADIAARDSHHIWCGLDIAGTPLYLKDRKDDGKWILTDDDFYDEPLIYEYRRRKDTPVGGVLSYLDNFDEFAENFEDSQAEEFRKWFYENEYDTMLRETLLGVKSI